MHYSIQRMIRENTVEGCPVGHISHDKRNTLGHSFPVAMDKIVIDYNLMAGSEQLVGHHTPNEASTASN
jgi:hypothetical protein